MAINRYLAVGIAITLLATPVLGQPEENEADEAEVLEATSLLESYQANLDAIEDVDVAIHWTQLRPFG